MTKLGTQDVVLTSGEFSMAYQITIVEPSNAIAQGTIGDITWIIDENGTLTLGGEGAIPSFVRKGTPWYANAKQITKVVVADGISAIGDYAFSDLTKVTDITIPASVKMVGIQFMRGTLVTEVELEGVEIIVENAFGRADSLERLILSEKVHDIRGNMFWAEALTVVAPEGSYVDYYLQTYDETYLSTTAEPTFEKDGVATRQILDFQKAGDTVYYTLYKEADGTWTLEYSGLGKMKNFAYPSEKNKLKGERFAPTRVMFDEDGASVKNIRNVVLGDAIDNLGNYALEMCTKVKTLELGEKMIRIGRHALKSLALTNFVIPEGVVLIDNYAFSTCPVLETLTIPSTIPTGDPNTMASNTQVGLGYEIFLKAPPATDPNSNVKLKVITENQVVIDYIIENYPLVAKNSGFTTAE
jgi:hypothetical protein